MSEEWRDVPGREGYQASSLGRLRSFRNRGGWGLDTIPHLLSPTFDKNGYPRVSICRKGKRPSMPVHRLVALCFLPNPHNKPQINHRNGIKTDNRPENLEWVTARENLLHSFRVLGRLPNRGERNGQTKLSDRQVAEIRALYAQKDEKGKRRYTYYSLAEAFEVCYSNIGYIVRGDSRRVLENE